jgi:quercetin dioxygenase-like cupin family protein
MALKVRRIIAGTAPGGSKVIADGPPPKITESDIGGAVLWSTPATPEIGIDAGEATERYPSFPPPPGETRFVLFCLAPGAVAEMHATDTIDHFALFEGELELHLEQGPPVILRAGDVVVCLGAKHKWANKTDKVAKAFSTLVGATRSS